MLKRNSIFIGLLFLLAVFAFANPLAAQQSKESAEAERAANAAKVLTAIMNIPENAIPDELMARAQGIAVIPHVVKGSFGFGGQWGKGLLSQRREDGSWSAPAYVEIGGGSFGLQIGVQAIDVVLVFTDEDGIRGLLKGKVKLGVDASATAGPVGRKAEVGMDDSANRKIYGNEVTGEEILLGKSVRSNPTVEPFLHELQKASPPHVHEKKVTQKSYENDPARNWANLR